MIALDLVDDRTARRIGARAVAETLDDHPYLADYLSPYPDFSDWRIRSTKCGVPRIRNMLAEAPARVYSRKTGKEYVFTAIEIIRGITRRDLRRLKVSKAAGSNTKARQKPQYRPIADF